MAEIVKILDNPVRQVCLEYGLEYATRLILNGKVVAFPTDTFYGLGADPFNLAAVNEIFRVKGRTADRPLPLLVESIEQALELTSDPPDLFFTLADKFWPGSLTIVLPASRLVPFKVTANTGKVGVRWPRSPIALGLIAATARPLTGTSANLSEHPACATAAEVNHQIGDSLPLILDGGPAPSTLASTVVEVEDERARILRPGAISEADLKEYLG